MTLPIIELQRQRKKERFSGNKNSPHARKRKKQNMIDTKNDKHMTTKSSPNKTPEVKKTIEN